MPEFVIESADERVFTIEAEDERGAIEALSRSRRLAPSSLKVIPTPREEREWGRPALLLFLGLFAAFVLALAL